MATVVVTGGSGFIGRALTARLALAGHSVISVSRKAVPGSTQLKDYREAPGADVLFHLAEEPQRAAVNALGEAYVQRMSALAHGLADGRYRRIIYGSSGAVYGDRDDAPFDVDSPVAASDVYTRSKLCNEQIMLDAGGLVVRFSNVYGAGMAANTVISDVLRQLRDTGPVRVRDASPVRDFVARSDAVEALALAAGSNYRGVLNVGSGKGTSVSDIANLILKLAGQSREIVSGEPSPRRSVNVLDISRTRKILGWSPASSLEHELRPLVSSALRSNNAEA
jgi:UDP-glucose 4-epimerase